MRQRFTQRALLTSKLDGNSPTDKDELMLFSDNGVEEPVGVFYQRWSKLADHMLAAPDLNMYLCVIQYPFAGGARLREAPDLIPRSLFSRWENPSTPTGGRSERTCHLAWSSLLLKTTHVRGS